MRSLAMFEGAQARDPAVRLHFIQHPKTAAEAFIESFIGRLRDESLNEQDFISLIDAQRKLSDWREYTTVSVLTKALLGKRQRSTLASSRYRNQKFLHLSPVASWR